MNLFASQVHFFHVLHTLLLHLQLLQVLLLKFAHLLLNQLILLLVVAVVIQVDFSHLNFFFEGLMPLLFLHILVELALFKLGAFVVFLPLVLQVVVCLLFQLVLNALDALPFDRFQLLATLFHFFFLAQLPAVHPVSFHIQLVLQIVLL